MKKVKLIAFVAFATMLIGSTQITTSQAVEVGPPHDWDQIHEDLGAALGYKLGKNQINPTGGSTFHCPYPAGPTWCRN